MKKRILAILLLLALAFSTIPAYAATGKVTTKTTTNLFDAYNATKKTWSELKTAQHRLSSNYVAYCLQHKKSVPNSETYNLDDLYDNYSDKVKKGLQIILTNGYPWETGGLTAAQAEYATANAVRFWLSECGDSEFYNQTNLGSFTDAQLRTLAASGTITKKIRARDASYIPALQFSVELLIKARAQQTITHDVGIGATNVSAARSGSVFSGSTSITVTNLRGGYTLDTSALPAGSTVTGYTGTQTETVTISIPASSATANKTYTLTVTGKDDRCRANIAAIGHNSNASYQRVVTVRIGTSWYTEVVTKTFTVTTGAYETPKPDLIITSLAPGKSSYLTGENMTFSATVKNQGAAAAGRFDVGLTLGDLTHYAYIDGLAVGASQAVSFSFTAPSTAQTVTLNGKADSLGGIDESNESNNTASTTATVVAPTYPDLVITSLTTNASSYTVGDSMTISAVVKNQGNAGSGAFNTSLTGSSGESEKKNCTGLAVGATTTLTWQWTAPASPCTLTLTGFADCDSAVTESDEGNNTRTASVSVIARKYPDLTVTSVTPEQASYGANSTVVVNSVIRNAGDKDAGTFVVRFTPEGMSAQTQTVTGLAVGATKTLRWTFTAPVLTSTQSKALTVVADSTGAVEESNENNNTGTGTVTIIGEKPDLTVTNLSAGASKYKPNETVTVTATVKNNGIVPCPASRLRLSGDSITTQTKDVPALAAGGSTTVTFTFSAPYVIGDKTFAITATADPDNAIAESNENNNSRNGSFTVSNPLPDLTVTKIQANKNEYTEEESGRVTVTVVNQGSKSVDSSKLTLKLGDFFTQTKTTGMIAAGSAAQVTFDFVAPETLERMTVTATATTDPNNEITESNENNNTLTSTLAVKPIPPDLAIIATNAQNWYAGKEVVVTATVVNYTKRAVPEVTVRLTLGSSRYEEVIPMPGNGSNLAVFRIKLPSATGSASLAFTVDPYNAIPEGNESNNDLSKTVQIVAVPFGIVLDPDLPELEQTYKTRGLLSIPNATNSDYHIWQEVRYESGSYVTRTYWAKLQTVFSLVPDPRIAYQSEPKRMESGFGVQVALRTQLTTNYDHPEKLVGAQMAWVYSPEAGYGQYPQWSGVFDSLQASGGTPGDKVVSWRYAVNPWSESGSRLHYTPLWFPDGQYTVLSQAFYAWSPAGQMYWYDAGSVDILGDMYDRVTAIQGR